jgi:DNA-directed RNA polymerase specialized sigma24 family protein
LLSQFIESKDEKAFTDLVNRLGPMVLSICRRIVGNNHLAVDAFLATFLVLALSTINSYTIDLPYFSRF